MLHANVIHKIWFSPDSERSDAFLRLIQQQPSSAAPDRDDRRTEQEDLNAVNVYGFRHEYSMGRDSLPPDLQEAVATWEAPLNPNFQVEFWNEKRVRAFLKKEYGAEMLRVFDVLKPAAWKADLARAAIVGRWGGWYSDIKQVLLRPLEGVLEEVRIRPLEGVLEEA